MAYRPQGGRLYAKKEQETDFRKIVLRLPDLDHAKSAVLSSLSSPSSRRNYKFAMDQFITWYCSEPRLALNRAVVLRFRLYFESLGLGVASALWNGDLHRFAGWTGPAVGCHVGGTVAQECRWRYGVVDSGLRRHGAGDANPAVCGLILPFDNEAESGGRLLELQRYVRVWSSGVLGCGSRRRG